MGQYFSIEHDKVWYGLIHPNITSRPTVKAYHLAAVDKGHGGWGGGFEEGTYKQFQHYVEAVDSLKVDKFDKVGVFPQLTIIATTYAGCISSCTPTVRASVMVREHI